MKVACPVSGPDLSQAAESRFALSCRVPGDFVCEYAGRLAEACLAMASRFHRGGKLIAFGCGGCATDAQHIAVEFTHPVLAGKRALAAIALGYNSPSLTAIAESGGFDTVFARQIDTLGERQDIAVGFLSDSPSETVARGMEAAGRKGMLTVLFHGRVSSAAGVCTPDYLFPVDCEDPAVIQETHETAYHILWELVHVFFGHKGLLEQPGAVPHEEANESGTSFLYPFLEAARDHEPEPVLAEVRESARMKGAEIVALRQEVWARHSSDLLEAALSLAEAFGAGKRIFAFGNGGSATDAADVVCDFLYPPQISSQRGGGRPPSLPAIALSNDSATVTAVGNDVGFDNVFSRQLIALAKPGDVALGISTSGNSRNIVEAFEAARRLDLVTIALVGYDGGRCAELAHERIIDHLFVVPSSNIPRIQEAQATVYHTLWDLTHQLLRERLIAP